MKYLTDCFPFLLLSDKSVEELNRRLEEGESDVRVSDAWFRPNISVKDVSGPFVEDEWTYVKIGDDGAVFRVNKLCGRCEYTNVDPETGTKVPRGEVHKVSALTWSTKKRRLSDKILSRHTFRLLHVPL